MKVLLTAFEPFGGEKINPALEVLEAMSSPPAGIELIKLKVPTVFGRSIDLVGQKIREDKPELILALGQAGGREKIGLERIAINMDDARIPDNEGQQPIDQPIRRDGPAAYFSTLPIKRIYQALDQAGLPAEVSNTAGTFVCNHLMYGILDTLARELPTSRGGFVHLPYLPEQVGQSGQASLALADMTRAVEIILEVCRDWSEDLKITGGKTH